MNLSTNRTVAEKLLDWTFRKMLEEKNFSVSIFRKRVNELREVNLLLFRQPYYDETSQINIGDKIL